MKPSKNSKYNVSLRIKVLMAERKVNSVGDLHKMLTDQRVDISYSQLARVVANTGKHLNIDLLKGLAMLFDCSVRDLFEE